jgi:hypothetical protein
MRSTFITLCLLMPGLVSVAQQATKTSAAPPEFKEMQQVEDHWGNAVTKRDQYALELVLAPQFIGISATGDVTTQRAFRGGHSDREWDLRDELENRQGAGAREGHIFPRL